MNSETFKLSKLRNIALAGILAAGVVGPTYVASTAHADDTAAQATQEQTDQSQQSSDDSNSFVKDLLGSTDTTDQDANDPTKTETVYVFNNADGSARNAIVTDWLKNVKGGHREHRKPSRLPAGRSEPHLGRPGQRHLLQGQHGRPGPRVYQGDLLARRPGNLA